MESEQAASIRSKLQELTSASWVDGYDREFIRNILAEENFDYLPAITNKRIEKLLAEDDFRKKHPNAIRHY